MTRFHPEAKRGILVLVCADKVATAREHQDPSLRIGMTECETGLDFFQDCGEEAITRVDAGQRAQVGAAREWRDIWPD